MSWLGVDSPSLVVCTCIMVELEDINGYQFGVCSLRVDWLKRLKGRCWLVEIIPVVDGIPNRHYWNCKNNCNFQKSCFSAFTLSSVYFYFYSTSEYKAGQLLIVEFLVVESPEVSGGLVDDATDVDSLLADLSLDAMSSSSLRSSLNRMEELVKKQLSFTDDGGEEANAAEAAFNQKR